MNRITVPKRANWEKTVESQGLTFHSRGSPYWNEGVAYKFTSAEIDTIEKAANDVHELYLAAAQRVIERDEFDKLALSPYAAALIKQSWNKSEQHLYGRFDMLYDGTGAPKMIEYNADTPTSLLEASVIQWYWLHDMRPQADQFNSLHEKLIDRWKVLGTTPTHFTTLRDIEEDVMTVSYLQDTAAQAGVPTSYIDLEDVGYEASTDAFVDAEGKRIERAFKLYPWEWMVNEQFSGYLGTARTQLVEPAWKMLWSNKGMLPILWEMAPNHPNLLPTYFKPNGMSAWAQKPLLSREGANVTLYENGVFNRSGGEYGEEGFVYQQLHHVRSFDGKNPVLGVWMIGDTASGMGIRESDGAITDNKSQFTPHYFEK
jgi:glutathionylspermidine synthase